MGRSTDIIQFLAELDGLDVHVQFDGGNTRPAAIDLETWCRYEEDPASPDGSTLLMIDDDGICQVVSTAKVLESLLVRAAKSAAVRDAIEAELKAGLKDGMQAHYRQLKDRLRERTGMSL